MDLIFGLILVSALVIFFYMTLWFAVSVIARRGDVADIAWGLGFSAVTACLSSVMVGLNPKAILIAILTALWGIRLATHIYLRVRNKPEDYRYRKWRTDWGRWFYPRSYLQVFLLQGFFMLLISTSAITAFADSFGKLGLLEAAGAVVWLTGFFFESVGDLELSRFVKNPANKGKLMTGGLWRYTRHPNYFGEVTQWWGIFLVVLSSPYGFLAIISPLTITFLILKVSGIPMLEKKYEGRADFAQYKRKTSAFFPLPPRS
jgi:steroid 5-alpha reductase family enzyme